MKKLPLTKRKGDAMLALSIALCLVTISLAYAASRLAHNMFMGVLTSQLTAQANTFAQDQAEILRNTAFGEISSEKNKPLEAENFYANIVVEGVRTNPLSAASEKPITIEIYHGDDLSPRATLHLTRSLWNRTGMPIGAIVAWPSLYSPNDGSVWLRCDGSPIASKYKTLRNLVGDTTPDFRGKFLRGMGSLDAHHASGGLLETQLDTDILVTGSFFTYIPQYIAHFKTIEKWWEGGKGYFDNHLFKTTGVFKAKEEYHGIDTRIDRRPNNKKHENFTFVHPISFDNSLQTRTAKETRPINIDVMYLIKAR